MTSQNEFYDKIGTTTKIIAYVRTFTDILFTKEIAEETDAKQGFETLAGKGGRSMPELA